MHLFKNHVFKKIKKKSVEEIKYKILKNKSSIEALRSLNILGISMSLLMSLLVTGTTIANGNMATCMQKTADAATNFKNDTIINILLNKERTYEEKNTILKDMFGDKIIESDEESDSKELNDIRNKIIVLNVIDQKSNDDAIILLTKEDRERIKYSIHKLTDMNPTMKILDIFMRSIYVLIFGLLVLFVWIYKCILEGNLYEEYLYNLRMDYKSKILLKIYQEYQKNSICIKVEPQDFKIDENTFNEAIEKLINEEMISQIRDNEYKISLNSITYIEEWLGINKNLDCNKKVEMVKKYVDRVNN